MEEKKKIQKAFPTKILLKYHQFAFICIFCLYSFFSVTPGFEAMKDQNICNKIMVKLIQNYSDIFETDQESFTEEQGTVIIVKVS